MWSLSEVVTARLCVKGNMSKPAELSTFRDVWSGQSGWRFGREMRLNVRLHNMLCSSVPTVGLARPLENRVQMFYLTEEPKYTLNMVSGWRSCFFSGEANLMGETGMMSANTGDTMIAFGHDGMFGFWMWWDQGSTCRILRKKKRKKKRLAARLLHLAPSYEWKNMLWWSSNFRFCSWGCAKTAPSGFTIQTVIHHFVIQPNASVLCKDFWKGFSLTSVLWW